MSNTEWPSYAKVSKVQKAIEAIKDLDGRYPKETIELKQPGSSDPAKVFKFAAEVTVLLIKMDANPYSPAKDDLKKCAEKVLARYERTAERETETEITETQTEEGTPAPSNPEDSESVPEAPTERTSTSVPSRSLQQNQMVNRISSDLGIEQDTVEKVVQAVIGEMNNAYLMGLIALANSLHFLASEHDKLPGHEARVKAIDSIRQQYVDAGTLTIRKSRSS